MGFFQWLRESGEPNLKCERVGHRLRRHYRVGWVPTKMSSWSVADRVRQERDFCERCRQPQSEWTEVDRDYIQSLSASSTTWDEIRAGGHFYDGGYVEPKKDKS